MISGPPDTAGVDLGGHIGQVHGRLPGLGLATSATADVGPFLAQQYLRHKAAKNFNDAPTDTTVGSEDGKVVKEPPSEWKGAPGAPSPFPVP